MSFHLRNIYQKLKDFFPLKKLALLIVILSVGIQLVINAYLHLSGMVEFRSIVGFVLTILFSSILSVIAGFLLVIPDLLVIKRMNGNFHWDKKVVSRIFIELGLALAIGIIVSILMTLLSNWIGGYRGESIISVLVRNALIFSAVNLMIMAILEAWLFSIESKAEKRRAENLAGELLGFRFEALKKQVDPHFLFNSLNVLSALVEMDSAKAQLFIDEFSAVYRYVLDTIDQQLVLVSREVEFIKSYIYLQQIRHEDAIRVDINLPENVYSDLLPPLSLQTVVENAIKHNVVDVKQPLKIEIYCEDRFIVVRNNIQPKISAISSTGLGQRNLIKRYELLGYFPVFEKINSSYIAQLPLIKEK